MQLKIKNWKPLNDWINDRRVEGHDIEGVKGHPPIEATYSDGEPINRPVNVAWKDKVSGDIFHIIYEEQDD